MDHIINYLFVILDFIITISAIIIFLIYLNLVICPFLIYFFSDLVFNNLNTNTLCQLSDNQAASYYSQNPGPDLRGNYQLRVFLTLTGNKENGNIIIQIILHLRSNYLLALRGLFYKTKLWLIRLGVGFMGKLLKQIKIIRIIIMIKKNFKS